MRVQWGAVRSSSVVTIGFYLILLLTNTIYPFNINFYLKVIFGASFVGMTSFQEPRYMNSALCSLVFLVAFYSVYPILPYKGGALGFSAFISVCVFKLAVKFKNFNS